MRRGNMIDTKSLSLTLDALNEAFFDKNPLTDKEKLEAARWLAGRQGLPGSYFGLIAPTEYDLSHDIRLFTGESIRSGAATSHILGEEACRMLILLNVPDKGVRDAFSRARSSITDRVGPGAGFF
jgi:hypothetical protein